MGSYFGEVAQIFELKRVGGAPKGHQFASLHTVPDIFPQNPNVVR